MGGLALRFLKSRCWLTAFHIISGISKSHVQPATKAIVLSGLIFFFYLRSLAIAFLPPPSWLVGTAMVFRKGSPAFIS